MRGSFAFLNPKNLPRGLVLGGGLWAASLSAVELHEVAPLSPPQVKLRLPDEKWAPCLHEKNNPDAVLHNQAKWELLCPIEDFLKKAQASRPQDPSAKLLVARLVHADLLRIKKEMNPARGPAPVVPPQAPPTGVAPDGDLQPFLKLLSPGAPVTPSASVPSSAPNPEVSAFLKKTEDLVRESNAWLKPLYSDGRSPRGSPLALEAALEYFLILGDGLRFNQAREFLREQGSLLWNKRWAQNEILNRVSDWVDAYPAPALREWLREKVLALRSSDISGSGGETELFYWLKSLQLSAPLTDGASKQFALNKLRELWVAYPGAADAAQIRETVEKLGLAAPFKAPGTREMSLRELLVRARSQVRALDTLGALRTLRRVRFLPKESVDHEELWDAFQFHVKVLRLLDERSQIPAVIRGYLALGHFLDVPTSRSELPRYLAHAADVARLYWNYDDADKASAVLDSIISLNEKNHTDYSLGPALVIKARIAEQGGRDQREKALALIDRALQSRIPQDLAIDLLWRKIFLQMDLNPAGSSAQNLLPLFDPLRKFAARDSGEKGRWHYWYAQVLLMNRRLDEAAKHLDEAYKAEPFSYYSNLAGLELLRLKKTPTSWALNPKAEPGTYEHRVWKSPNWELFFSLTNGKPHDGNYRDLARIYYLAEMGDLNGARRAFVDLDRVVWTRVLSSRVRWESRLQFVRAVAWLRMALGDPMGGLKASEIARQANAKGFDKEDYFNLYPLPFWAAIGQEAKKQDISPWLVASLIRQESAFNTRARSWANAIGLMQMIPPVAMEEARLMGRPGEFIPESLYDPQTALELGVHHLARLVKSFENSWICAIASYNAGSPPVIKWIGFYANEYPTSFIERIPFLETRNYVKSILRNYINYQRIYGRGEIDLGSMLLMPKAVPGTLLTRKSPSTNSSSETESSSSDD